MLELDVNNPADFETLAAELRDRWGGVDGALHAIAFAPGDALGGNFMSAPPESAEVAFRTSAYSFKALAQALVPLMDDGGSLVGMDFDASSPGRSTTGWAWRRRHWNPCPATWRATSATRTCA